MTFEGGTELCRSLYERMKAKKAPEALRWLYTAIDRSNCAQTPPLAPACDAFEAVAQTGQLSKCPEGPLNGYCRALFGLNEKECRRISVPDATLAIEACLQAVRDRRPFAADLPTLAKAKEPLLSSLARATLGQPDPCLPLRQALVADCEKNARFDDQPNGPQMERKAGAKR
jgi:hypothetical protein